MPADALLQDIFQHFGMGRIIVIGGGEALNDLSVIGAALSAIGRKHSGATVCYAAQSAVDGPVTEWVERTGFGAIRVDGLDWKEKNGIMCAMPGIIGAVVFRGTMAADDLKTRLAAASIPLWEPK